MTFGIIPIGDVTFQKISEFGELDLAEITEKKRKIIEKQYHSSYCNKNMCFLYTTISITLFYCVKNEKLNNNKMKKIGYHETLEENFQKNINSAPLIEFVFLKRNDFQLFRTNLSLGCENIADICPIYRLLLNLC